MSAPRRLHRLVGDGDRHACGWRPYFAPYAVRFRAFAVAFLARNPEFSPCARCWPDIPGATGDTDNPTPATGTGDAP